MILYNNSIADRLLGCLIQEPSLVTDEKYNMGDTFKNEFMVRFHKIVYVCIYNLYVNGCNSISCMDINEYLSAYTAEYEVYKDNNGDDYIETIVGLVDKDNFDAYYNDFMKLSCLRYYYEQKCDVSKFFDVDKNEQTEMGNLNNYTIDDIINYFEDMNIDAKKKYYPKSKEVVETHGGDGMDEFLSALEETPLYGHSYSSELMNTVTRGMLDGQISCFSSPSGKGKTTVAVGTLCKTCCTKYWDYETECFIDNPSRTHNGGLYIQFELDNVSELGTKFLSWISGVSANIILDGKYTDEQRLRIATARQILDDSNIHKVYMPNFTQKLIDMTIKEYVIRYGVDFVVYDYIQEGASLNGEMNHNNGGVGLRTDQVLANFTDFLKGEARKYNIPIYTMTQTNANLGMSEVVGAESIAGSRAVQNKLDIGGVLLPIRPKEEKALEEIELSLHQRGFNLVHPNYIYHMYKVRFGSYPQDIKVWVHIDLGTGRMKDCFCTDWRNKPISVPKTQL